MNSKKTILFLMQTIDFQQDLFFIKKNSQQTSHFGIPFERCLSANQLDTSKPKIERVSMIFLQSKKTSNTIKIVLLTCLKLITIKSNSYEKFYIFSIITTCQ